MNKQNRNLITDTLQMEYRDPFIKEYVDDKECTPETIYMVQTQIRIFVKSILYRVLGFSLTVFITYYFTGNYKKSFNVGIIVELTQTIIYYLYEQLWNNIDWGYTSKTTLL